MSNSEIIIFKSKDNKSKIEVKLENNNVWLTQNEISNLFDKSRSTITEHINNIFKDCELDEKSTVGLSDVANSDKPVKIYNLDVIIAIGYRVKSSIGIEFRKWATERLKEYLIQGFTINDEFLKNNGGGIYWKNLLNRIRDIRSSEKVLYRQVLDLYSTSMDYSPEALESIKFFKIVQNKLHYAVSKETAAEIIYNRVNANDNFMGLTTFEGKFPTKQETHIAKNYLKENEIKDLNSIVSAFFDLAEMKARNHEAMYMKDWINELDDFSNRYGKGSLINSGKISHKEAICKANNEYEKYKIKSDAELSDVEKEYVKLLNSEIKKIDIK
ncbi:MAG: RhuM family protein [Clostridia bacterium]